MGKQLRRFLRVTAIGLVAAGIGCTTTGREGVDPSTQGATADRDEAGEQTADSLDQPRLATDLLQEAEQEFRTANAAQERGDYEAALRHYNKMLELLVEADLDPSIFYNLRTEFERILGGPQEQARLFPESPAPDRWTAALGESTGPSLDFPQELRERVEIEIREIQELYPRSFQYGLNRSAKYMPYIQEEFRKAGLPEDLAWLAMVESQFTPKIVSPAGAGGMWQFMRAAAGRFGLRVDSYVDERYNWEKATHAAIAYLTELHRRFDGNWPLAVSAYNMGEGGMERCVAMNGGETDLIRLLEQPPASNVMKNETKKFYPKLLASIEVAKNAEKYGFRYEPQAPDITTRVPVRGSYSLAALDSACGLPEGTLRRLNPDLIRGVTPPTGVHMVAIPVEAQDRFQLALANVPTDKKATVSSRATSDSKSSSSSRSAKSSGGASHTVRRGETLSSIARHYGVEVKDLMEANNLKSSRHLLAGKRLTIPGAATAKAPAPEKPVVLAKRDDSSSPAPASSAALRSYTVKRGDTLSQIAKREGCTVDQLLQWNDIRSPRSLRAGETLRIGTGSSGSSAAAAPKDDKVIHVVKAGEYPAKIAGQYGVKVDDLMKWNSLDKNSAIRPGQKLTVHGASAKAPASSQSKAPAAPQPVTHVVAKGETASTIAARYGVGLSDFLKWNNLTAKSTLRVGQKCVVYPANGKGASGGKAASSASRTVEHKVVKGESPASIAKKHGVSVNDLFRWNGWKKGHVLQIGDKVVIQK